MDIGSLFLILTIVLLVGLYVGKPFMERRSDNVSEKERRLSGLMAERDRILDTLQELDFDHAMGKIPAEDYPTQRAVLLERGAEILRALDAQGDAGLSSHADSVLEAAIQARQTEKIAVQGEAAVLEPEPGIGVTDYDEIEALISKRRQERSGTAAGFCPECGQPVQVDDQFCARCGAGMS